MQRAVQHAAHIRQIAGQTQELIIGPVHGCELHLERGILGLLKRREQRRGDGEEVGQRRADALRGGKQRLRRNALRDCGREQEKIAALGRKDACRGQSVVQVQYHLTRRASGRGKLRTGSKQRRSADARFQTTIPRGAVAIADDAVLRTEGRPRQKVESGVRSFSSNFILKSSKDSVCRRYTVMAENYVYIIAAWRKESNAFPQKK